MPPAEAEIILFAVTPEYPDLGIGSTLMDRFVEHAVKKKVLNPYQ